ncbi:SMP-30/gluconolactonase/LRE family protein [Streptomyces abikoensis]
MNVEIALPAQAGFGEGPTWDTASSTLLWVDMGACTVHRFDPADGSDTATAFGQPVAAAKPRTGGQGLVLSLRDGVAVTGAAATGAAGTLRWLTDWSSDGVRGNDAAVDGAGRLWVGTIASESSPGRLARIPPRGKPDIAVDGLQISNGIAWSPDTTRMYHVDSPTRRIDVFDYDIDTGRPVNRRVFADVTDTAGVPDGLCTDTDGGVWVALFRGGAIRRYTPGGRLDREIRLPASLTTACGFGGPGLTDLYVTTARRHPGPAEPLAGNLFVVSDAAQGLAPVAFDG